MQAVGLTRWLFVIDMVINWGLGTLLVSVPRWIDGLLGVMPVLPPLLYRLIGLALLAFAAWQASALARQSVTAPGSLIFAGILALLPTLALADLLVFFDLRLSRVGRFALWTSVTYMFLLGAWYLTVWLSSHRQGLGRS